MVGRQATRGSASVRPRRPSGRPAQRSGRPPVEPAAVGSAVVPDPLSIELLDGARQPALGAAAGARTSAPNNDVHARQGRQIGTSCVCSGLGLGRRLRPRRGHLASASELDQAHAGPLAPGPGSSSSPAAARDCSRFEELEPPPQRRHLIVKLGRRRRRRREDVVPRDRSAGSRIAEVSRQDVGVQVRDGVAERQQVQLDGSELGLHRPGDIEHIAPVAGGGVRREARWVRRRDRDATPRRSSPPARCGGAVPPLNRAGWRRRRCGRCRPCRARRTSHSHVRQPGPPSLLASQSSRHDGSRWAIRRARVPPAAGFTMTRGRRDAKRDTLAERCCTVAIR